MEFRHPQQRDDFIRHVRSLFRPDYVDDAGNRIEGYPMIPLQQVLRGVQVDDGQERSHIGRGWVWDIPSGRRDFARLLRKCGFQCVSARYRDRPTARGGPFLVVCEILGAELRPMQQIQGPLPSCQNEA